MTDPKEPREFNCTDDSPFNNGTWSDETRPLYYPRNRDAECYDFNDQVETEWEEESEDEEREEEQ